MEKKVLKRRISGFVKYPSDFEKRTIDGLTRYRTKCDMLVGPCACGWVHQENEEWVQELLAKYNATIEPFILLPDNGSILIPRYWSKPENHCECTHLRGECACGHEHKANEHWVVKLLQKHNTTIICEEAALPIVNEEHEYDTNTPILDDSGGAIVGCNCSECQRTRFNAKRSGRLNRINL
jgi:hypothetical protein